jgi:hypothetical protein
MQAVLVLWIIYYLRSQYMKPRLYNYRITFLCPSVIVVVRIALRCLLKKEYRRYEVIPVFILEVIHPPSHLDRNLKHLLLTLLCILDSGLSDRHAIKGWQHQSKELENCNFRRAEHSLQTATKQRSDRYYHNHQHLYRTRN